MAVAVTGDAETWYHLDLLTRLHRFASSHLHTFRSAHPRQEIMMHPDHIKARLHNAIHRSPKALSNQDMEEVLAVTLAALGELAVELSLVVGELAARVETLETAAAKT